ncbi:MAG: MATE family efflux transporter, partial [Thermoguttaceae bacterium]|nr:MATE family efflux transporter [Thermoguttaceae bacterium]
MTESADEREETPTKIPEERGYWGRPCGIKDVVWLATPIIISSGSVALMNFCDRVFLTWFDQYGMSAAFLAGSLGWGLGAFPFGIAVFVNTFVAQYFGAQKYKRVGPIVWQGAFVGFIFGPLFVLATPLVEQFFTAIEHTAEVVGYERDYWFYFALGMPAIIANEALAAFFCGRREMKTVMAVGLFAVIMNVILDYFLIFGINGDFRFGVAGAAMATSISMWMKFALFLYLMLRRDKDDVFAVRKGFRLMPREFFRLFKYGAMSSTQTTIENWTFTLFVLLIGSLGDAESISTAIAFNLEFLVFMPITGIGVAVSTLV